MTDKFKTISSRLVFFANIGCLLLLLFSDLALVLSPAKWWLISLTGLIFPLLLLAAIGFIIFWLFVQWKKAIWSLAFVVISIPNISRSFAFHFSSSFIDTKQPANIRVITWNVNLMNYSAKDSATASDSNAIILKELKTLNADVICLQEFFTALAPGNPYNLLDSIARSFNYPYRYFSYDYPKFNGEFYSGSLIFSKYKMVDSSKIIFADPFAGSVIKTGLLVDKDTIDIITTRLQSVHFGKEEYKTIERLKKVADSSLEGSKNVLSKLKYGYTNRTAQINLVKTMIASSNRPLIFTGDLNDIPSSYTYTTLKADMKDAWLSNGSGLGRTFSYISPTLRIDYIFYNHFFTAEQTKRIFTHSTDHYGIVTDFKLSK